MPLPTETLLRVQLSPVPTQMVLWLEGSIVTAPIDCTSCLSNTGRNVVAPLIDFQTPPLAEPTKIVTLPFSSTASMAAIRPLIAADPILRAFKPEMVPESYFSGRGVVWADAVTVKTKLKTTGESHVRRRNSEHAFIMETFPLFSAQMVGPIS